MRLALRFAVDFQSSGQASEIQAHDSSPGGQGVLDDCDPISDRVRPDPNKVAQKPVCDELGQLGNFADGRRHVFSIKFFKLSFSLTI